MEPDERPAAEDGLDGPTETRDRAPLSREDRARSQEADAVDPALAELDEADIEDRGLVLFDDRRRLVSLVLAFVLLLVAIYVFLPKVAGLEDTMARIGDADWYWVAVAILFSVVAYGAYGALFRGILGGQRGDALHRRIDARASYQITMAGVAASRVFSAAGAGGIALTYWALRKAGMERRRAICRMVAFLVLLYAVYLAALVLFGLLLRSGTLPGERPFGGTIVPAVVAAAIMLLFGIIAFIPGDFECRLEDLSRRLRWGTRLTQRLAAGSATVAMGIRTALAYVRRPRQGALAVTGALGFWGGNIGILWASFEAFGGDVSFAVLVQGFFVGMVANLIPSPAAGAGSVDAGMIGAFVLFGVPTDLVFPAVLTYRVIAFWLPIPPGILAYFQLRRTVAGWQVEGDAYALQNEVSAEVT